MRPVVTLSNDNWQEINYLILVTQFLIIGSQLYTITNDWVREAKRLIKFIYIVLSL